MRRTAATLVAAGLLVGCGPSTEEADEGLDALQGQLVAATEDAVAAVEDTGLSVLEAGGEAEYCKMPPAPGVTYRTGARLAEGDDPHAQITSVRDALVGMGWTVEAEGSEPEPYVTLTRDDLRASAGVSRRIDEPGVTFGFSGPCLDVPDDWSLGGDDHRVDIAPATD